MDDASNIATAADYLRRTKTLAELKALMAKVGEEALGETVTLTGNSFEGGTASGVITFPRMAYLSAIMAIIDELDPTNAPTRAPTQSHADFSLGRIEA